MIICVHVAQVLCLTVWIRYPTAVLKRNTFQIQSIHGFQFVDFNYFLSAHSRWQALKVQMLQQVVSVASPLVVLVKLVLVQLVQALAQAEAQAHARYQ